MDLSWLEHYVVWLAILLLILVHLTLYKGTKRALSKWLDDDTRHIFMMVPLPMWGNLIVFHFSILFTFIILWLIARLCSL